MEALTIKKFKPDKIAAISADERSGEFNYTSVTFAYDGGEMPPIRIDGNLGYLDLETNVATSIGYQ